jgi:hypothetical protein
MAAQHGMVHINLDQDGDAALKEGVKLGWETFATNIPNVRNPRQFVEEIRRRIMSSGAKGAVVTCTSGVMPSILPGDSGGLLSKEYVCRMRDAGICTVVLYGSTADCMSSFLEREKTTGRNIGDSSFWQGNNGMWYDQSRFSVPEFQGLIVHAFANGKHRVVQEMVEEIQKRFMGQP